MSVVDSQYLVHSYYKDADFFFSIFTHGYVVQIKQMYVFNQFVHHRFHNTQVLNIL